MGSHILLFHVTVSTVTLCCNEDLTREQMAQTVLCHNDTLQGH